MKMVNDVNVRSVRKFVVCVCGFNGKVVSVFNRFTEVRGVTVVLQSFREDVVFRPGHTDHFCLCLRHADELTCDDSDNQRRRKKNFFHDTTSPQMNQTCPARILFKIHYTPPHLPSVKLLSGKIFCSTKIFSR